MIDMVKLFEEFEQEQERQNTPREKVRQLVNNYCRKTGQSHSLAWRMLYIRLESRTGYRVPENAKSRLQAIEAAGYIEDLFEVAKTLN